MLCHDKGVNTPNGSCNLSSDTSEVARDEFPEHTDISCERSHDIRDMSRDRSLIRRNISRDTRDASGNRSGNPRDTSRDRSLNTRDTSRDRSLNTRDTSRDRSLNTRDTSRDRSRNTRDTLHDRHSDINGVLHEKSHDSWSENTTNDRAKNVTHFSRGRIREYNYKLRGRSHEPTYGRHDSIQKSRDRSHDPSKMSYRTRHVSYEKSCKSHKPVETNHEPEMKTHGKLKDGNKNTDDMDHENVKHVATHHWISKPNTTNNGKSGQILKEPSDQKPSQEKQVRQALQHFSRSPSPKDTRVGGGIIGANECNGLKNVSQAAKKTSTGAITTQPCSSETVSPRPRTNEAVSHAYVKSIEDSVEAFAAELKKRDKIYEDLIKQEPPKSSLGLRVGDFRVISNDGTDYGYGSLEVGLKRCKESYVHHNNIHKIHEKVHNFNSARMCNFQLCGVV